MAETVFSAPAPGADPAAPGPAPAAMLQVRVGEASWVEVRDARGTTLLSRTVSPGEQVGLNGVPPLALVVGNAAATELVFRGRAVDLSARSRDNVARFQLP
jgi:cytoskeleton protein RodZ